MNNLPITYIPNFIKNPNEILEILKNELKWLRVAKTRSEYYTNDFNVPYTYGSGKGIRTYESQPMHPTILEIRKQLESYTNTVFEVCFLNRYLNQSDHLGFHSDNSPEMDDNRPIGIISLGVERLITFKEIANPTNVHNLKLENGSLCLMEKFMQDSWLHKIPKASFMCGERVSLTFRGYAIIK